MKSLLLPNTLTIQQEPHQAPPDDPVVTGSTQTFVTLFFTFKFIFLQLFYFERKTFIFTRPRHSLPLAGRAHRLFSPDPQAAVPQLLFYPCRRRRKTESSSIRIQPESCCPKRTSRPPPETPNNPLTGVRAYRPGTSNYVPESSASTATSPEADFRPSSVSLFPERILER